MPDKRVLILMGSDSDLPAMQRAADALDEMKVGYDMHVASAHRSPERVAKLTKQARQLGYRVLIIDMDPQGNSSDGLGLDTNKLDNTIYDVLVNDVPVSDTVIPNHFKNLFVF